MKQRIHEEANGLDYILAGDYYISAIELPESDDRSIGKWGRMHRTYLEENEPAAAQPLDFDRQAAYLSCRPQRIGIGTLSQAEEIIRNEMIYV